MLLGRSGVSAISGEKRVFLTIHTNYQSDLGVLFDLP